MAHAALTESVVWIIGFIQFIDKYYRELSKAKFGPTKAWHVMTHLAKRMLEEAGMPRYSVQGAFQVCNSTQICQQIFWAVLKGLLKGHNIMSGYKLLNFKNHPSIATELVKFLAINTNFKAIERLTIKTATLELGIKDSKKEVTPAVKATALAANKSDEMKKANESLSKQVQKLEDKVSKL